MTARRLVLALTFAIALAIAAVFYFFDPARGLFYPPCLFHQLTGLSCPGCGSLRALHHLTHGEVATAFGYNPLLIVLLPFFAFLVASWFRQGSRAFQNGPFLLRPATAWALLAVTLLFTVLRNLPWPAFAWMSP